MLLCGINTQADSPTSEATNLHLILRQLDTIERIARTSQALPPPEDARYSFDYPRFIAEIELIRQGIKAYQTPTRAQPRTPPELTGHYTRLQSPAP
ncbi:RAQPRD family integrative conjugative element protein [Pseudomonas capsici]|uniref:integrative conjugative element protein, RAQPRD family n=1 Tax=Pseudomonas capsici TaxID=2810614 RepID=UPI0021F24947|nr:RAQPRD family integrative conjugative element protein [Pseudomonas capsici]MCV4286446.1 RAQPRD family integrative conjugative element protein [Pseudomonas capsici]